jgi:two-component system CheB/CheR fusion protein
MTEDVTLKDLLQELAEHRAFDFRGYKRTTLERRLRKRMFELSIGTYADYSEYIRRKPEEINKLLTTILINVTEFFRDPPAWEILRNDILPPMLKSLKPGMSFRAWSAGCASGEEAYSIAIVLADILGPRISEFDVKIYATDLDEEELTTARSGEYSAEALRRIRPEWRDQYFHGEGTLRVNREIRRLVIFGRSNLGQDAPISHVNLLLCRNVLIYFDSELQAQILSRLHYALEPGGILFLGKSESQLTNSTQFRRLNARWRIFRRVKTGLETDSTRGNSSPSEPEEEVPLSRDAEFVGLRLQHRYLMETLRVGVLVLGADDVVVQNNSAILVLYGLPPTNLVGKRLSDTELPVRTPELATHLQSSHLSNETVRFQSPIKVGNEERLLEISLRPIHNEHGERTGTFVYCDDVSVHEKLEATIEALESTGAELQSANEELETTNEELQSTNEELETTNEELQSTNEELETTNEELQSLNEELETTNQELEERSKEFDQVNTMYSQTLEKIRLPMMLVNQDSRIEFWNSMALRLLGFRSKPSVALQLEQLPIPAAIRNRLIRRYRAALVKLQPSVVRNQPLGGKLRTHFDIHLSLIQKDNRPNYVLIMFEARQEVGKQGRKSAARRGHSKR